MACRVPARPGGLRRSRRSSPGFKALLRCGPAGAAQGRVRADEMRPAAGAALVHRLQAQARRAFQGDIRDQRGNAGQIYYRGMAMIGVRAIALVLCRRGASQHRPAATSSARTAFIRDKIGFESLSRRDPGMKPPTCACRRTARSNRGPGFDPASVDCVIVCTQNPDARVCHHTSAVVTQARALPAPPASTSRWAVPATCAGSRWRPRSCRRTGCVPAAVHRRSVFEDPRPAGLGRRALFGDAATVTWLAPDPVYRCRPAIFGSGGSGPFDRGAAPGKPARDAGQQRVQVQHDRGAGTGADTSRERLSFDDIDLVLLRQGSRFIVDNLGRKLGLLRPDKAPFEAGRQLGNTRVPRRCR